MIEVHPTALVHPKAKLDDGVKIGPFSVVEEHVAMGKDTHVLALAHIKGHTTLGCNNIIHTGAVIGEAPQDRAFEGKTSYVTIGDNNVFRENVTVHRGSKLESKTVIGNNNLFMVNAHVAHNNVIGDHVIMVNNSVLAGYVEVQDHATIGAYCAVHQFCRVGKYAFMRGYARASRDVPPFCIVEELHTVRALNVVGLKRAGFSSDRLHALKEAFKLLFRSERNLKLAMERVEREVELTEDVRFLLDFIKLSKRGVAVGQRNPPEGAAEDFDEVF
jgi:UDP-N-acetylglucosamine acyltransferase